MLPVDKTIRHILLGALVVLHTYILNTHLFSERFHLFPKVAIVVEGRIRLKRAMPLPGML